MARLFFVISLLLSLSLHSYKKVWVTPKKKVIALKRTTRCKKFVEKYGKTFSCDCCLIKYSKLKGVKGKKLHKKCNKKSYCSLPNLKKERRGELLKNAKKRLDILDIVDVNNLNENVEKYFEKNDINEESVQFILKELVYAGYLEYLKPLLRTRKSIKCIKVKSLNESGYYTGQIFSLKYNARCLENNTNNNWQTLYILKETKKGLKEISNLYKINKTLIASERIPTSGRLSGNMIKESDRARISFDDLHFRVRIDGTIRYFSLLQTAQGQSFKYFLKELVKRNGIDSKEQFDIKDYFRMFYRIGFSVAKLHSKYNFTHGDFHLDNIFYNPRSERVTLIDNETMALSIGKKSQGINDIIDLYIMSSFKTVAHLVAPNIVRYRDLGIDDDLWHKLFAELLFGYLEGQEPRNNEQYSIIYENMKKKFMVGLSNMSFLISTFKSIKSAIDQRTLKRLGISLRRVKVQVKYVKKMFAYFKKRIDFELEKQPS